MKISRLWVVYSRRIHMAVANAERRLATFLSEIGLPFGGVLFVSLSIRCSVFELAQKYQ